MGTSDQEPWNGIEMLSSNDLQIWLHTYRVYVTIDEVTFLWLQHEVFPSERDYPGFRAAPRELCNPV